MTQFRLLLQQTACPWHYSWNQRRRFVLRPPPLEGETVWSYLIRLAAANGLEGIRPLRCVLLNFGYSDIRQALCVGARLSRLRVDKLFGPYPVSWRVPVNHAQLVSADFNHLYMRWCPACLSDKPYLRKEWALKSACVCTHHATWLSDCCPVCGLRQKLERVELQRCRCGAYLGDAARISAPESVVRLQKAMEAATFGEAYPAKLPILDCVAWQRLLRYLGQFGPRQEPVRPGQIAGFYRLDVARELMSSLASLLAGWPASFEDQLCLRQVRQTHSASLRKTYGRLYRVIYRNLSGAPFQFLRDAFEQHLSKSWPWLLNGRHRSLQTRTRQKHARLTVRQVVHKSGLRRSVIDHLAEAGVIGSERLESPSGRVTRTLPSSEIQALSETFAGDMNLRAAARCLALPRRRLRELIDAGVLVPRFERSEYRAAVWMIPRDQIERLRCFPARGVEIPDGVRVRGVLQSWRLRAGEFAALVRAILRGDLSTANAGTEAVGLGDALISASAAHACLDQWRVRGASEFSVDEAAQKLGLKQQVVYELVRNGLMSSTTINGRGRRISAEAIHQFQTEFVSLSELATQAGCSPRKLQATLSVLPVCGPTVDGCRQYFLRRSDLNLFEMGETV
jgi:excisionase family DNA binding protein